MKNEISLLTEQNYIEQINSYSNDEWNRLLKLIPEIEKTQKFGKWKGGDKDENGIITMPYCISAPIVDEFFRIVYEMPIIINFPWPEWKEGIKFLQDNKFKFDGIDIPTKCKLITAIIRKDRFCEGALVSAFETGIILKILKSIERQLKE